jgi:hypothetical protein
MTQSYGDETAAILGYLKAQWAERTPMGFPNQQIDPEGVTHANVRIARQGAFNVAGTATDKLVRHPGLLTIEIRSPAGEGDGEALDHGDYAAGLFRNLTLSGITFRAPTVRDFAPRSGSKWYVVQVTCPYQRDSIHTHS